MANALLDFLSSRPAAHYGGLSHEFIEKLRQDCQQRFTHAYLIIDNSNSTTTADGKTYHNADFQTAMFERTEKVQRAHEICQRAADSLAIYRMLGIACTIGVLNPTHSLSPAIPYTKTDKSFTDCLQYIDDVKKNICGGTPLAGTLDRLLPPDALENQHGIILNLITDGEPYGHSTQLVNGHLLANQPESIDRVIDKLRLRAGILQRSQTRRSDSSHGAMNVVVNLATEKGTVIDTYNELDKLPGVAVDVLDDPWCERDEIEKANPEFAYSLPLHLFRQAGVLAHDNVFNVLDEREMTSKELLELTARLTGYPLTSYSMEHLPNLLAQIPLLQLPKVHRTPFGDYSHSTEVKKPLVSQTAIISALIDQQPGFFNRLYLRIAYWWKRVTKQPIAKQHHDDKPIKTVQGIDDSSQSNQPPEKDAAPVPQRHTLAETLPQYQQQLDNRYVLEHQQASTQMQHGQSMVPPPQKPAPPSI